MREIKFRIIWKRKVHYWGYVKGGFAGLPTSSDGLNLEKAKELSCQFIGLLDKNGKEIYEGDIVNLKSQYETDEPIDTNSKVEYSDGSFRLDFHAMILNRTVLEYSKSNWLIEVIGNIYENPELLTWAGVKEKE